LEVEKMGLLASIYKTGEGSCSSGGISSRYDKVIVVNIDGPFEPRDGVAAVELTKGPTGHPIIVPVERGEGAGPMFGGCFVFTSDSRFREATELQGAVPLHDRWER